MNKIRLLFFVLLGAFGLMGLTVPTFAFAAEKSTTKSATSAKVDVNNATQEELENLPGVGKVYAKKIVDGRPYKNQADLVKAGIPQNTVDKIKDSIKFGRTKTADTPKKREAKEPKETTRTRKSDTSDETAKVPPRKGMVWVNTDSMIYHKEGDRWYGNTKNGKFMTEKDAIKAGARISEQD